MIDPFWTQVLVAIPATIASCSAWMYARRSHDQSMKNTEKLEQVVEQTNGMSEKLQRVAEEKGHREGVQEQKNTDNQAKP